MYIREACWLKCSSPHTRYMRVTAHFEWEKKEDDEIDVPLAEIPASVLAVVRRAVPGAVVRRAEVEIEEFKGRDQGGCNSVDI